MAEDENLAASQYAAVRQPAVTHVKRKRQETTHKNIKARFLT